LGTLEKGEDFYGGRKVFEKRKENNAYEPAERSWGRIVLPREKFIYLEEGAGKSLCRSGKRGCEEKEKNGAFHLKKKISPARKREGGGLVRRGKKPCFRGGESRKPVRGREDGRGNRQERFREEKRGSNKGVKEKGLLKVRC